MEPKNETKPKVVQIRTAQQKDKTAKTATRIIVRRGSGPRPGGDAA